MLERYCGIFYNIARFDFERGLDTFVKLAVPFDASELNSLHDPEVRAALSGREVVVYHGTSSKRLAKILQHGSLDPDRSNEVKVHDNSSPGIFVTKNPTGFTGAELYANIAAQNPEKGDNSDRVILELVIPIDWILPDPDDTKYDEQGNMNDLGRSQGIVTKSVNVKRIRNVLLEGQQITQVAPAGYEESNIFDRYKTEWLPVGVMLDKIRKAIKANVELPEEYYEMVSTRSRGLSRSAPASEKEEQAARGIINMYDNVFQPGGLSHDKVLLFFLNNPNLLYSSAESTLKLVFDSLGVGWEEMVDGLSELPKQHESLFSYFKRAGYV